MMDNWLEGKERGIVPIADCIFCSNAVLAELIVRNVGTWPLGDLSRRALRDSKISRFRS